jgi:hypothetical protein
MRLEKTRASYRSCQRGETPHRFVDTVNGHVLQHGYRHGVQGIVRICSICRDTEADILKRATPEHAEEVADVPHTFVNEGWRSLAENAAIQLGRRGITANVIEGEEHDGD